MMLETLKRILGITDDTQDTFLTQLLTESQEYVEDYLDRQLGVDSYQDYQTPNGSNSMALRNFPVKTIELIENLDGNEVTEYKVIKQSGVVRTNQNLFGDFLVDYTAGYDPLPSWATKAIVDTAVAIYYQEQAGGATVATGAIKSEEIFGVAKVTYETGTGASSSGSDSDAFGPIPGSVIEILEKHKNRYA